MIRFCIAVALLILFMMPFALSQTALIKEDTADDLFAAPLSTLAIGTATVGVAIADTHEARRKGLSGVAELAEYQGLFFVFPKNRMYGIWMKDMQFPIDIIWFDEHLIVVDIARHISPDTFPAAFFPQKEARYILEVHAGFSDQHGVEIGEQASIEVNQEG